MQDIRQPVERQAAPEERLAWQGILLKVPPGWEPSVLDPEYLRLESEGRQVLDLRWSRIKGGFDPQKYLVKLKSSLKSQAEMEPGLGPWRERGEGSLKRLAQNDLLLAGFRWREKRGPGQGPGAVVYNPATQRAVLFFFSLAAEGEAGQGWPGVLASLVDQAGEDWQDWAVFDLSMKVPGGYGLKRHSFRPGHFQFLFESGSDWLILERLGPADVLLAGGDIADWAQGFYKNDKTGLRLGSGLHTFQVEDRQVYEWQSGPQNPRSGLAAYLKLNRPASLSRIWQPVGSNLLLVARLGGKSGIDRRMFDTVCEHYALV